MSETLLITLGGEPQVVTITLDLLSQRGHVINEVVAIHTDGSRDPSRSSLLRLRDEVRRRQSLGRELRYREAEIHDDNGPLADIEDEAATRATFATIFNEALQVKRSDSSLHICIAGGRKTMAVYGMATAQLLFDERDYLWHIVSFGKLLADRRMSLEPGDQVALVPIPITRWSGIPPVMTEVGRALDPEQALQAVAQRQVIDQRRRVAQFVKQELTQAERDVVELAVQQDWTYKGIAVELHRSHRTVDTQLQAVYRKMESFFGIEHASRMTLVNILGDYWR